MNMNNDNEPKNGIFKGVFWIIIGVLLGYTMYMNPATGLAMIMFAIIIMAMLLAGESPLFYFLFLALVIAFEGPLVLEWDFTNRPIMVYMGLDSIIYRTMIGIACLFTIILLIYFTYGYIKNQKHPVYSTLMKAVKKWHQL